MHWGIVPGQCLRQHGWDGEYVVYNDLSGDTHLLGTAAQELLSILRQAPLTLAALAGRLGLDDGQHGELEELLAGLARLGLVEAL